MQETLTTNLLACLAAYSGYIGKSETWVGNKATGGDFRFFTRIQQPGVSFTVARYDEIMKWFSDNWPDGVDWPEGVTRPVREEA